MLSISGVRKYEWVGVEWMCVPQAEWHKRGQGIVQLQNVGFKHEYPMGLVVGLLASAGRGFSPPTCIVLYCV